MTPSDREDEAKLSEFLILSVHDFRSRRKASVHFITQQLAGLGHTRFFSVGFSRLSEHRGDTRSDLRDRAGLVETIDNVQCALIRRNWHPFRLHRESLSSIEAGMFALYRASMPSLLRRWIVEAKTIFVESGLAVVYVPDIRRLNPLARIVYLASDDLQTIGAAQTIRRSFARHFDKIDLVRLPSRYMLDGLPHARTAMFAPHGVDRSIAERRYDNPYGDRKGAVSVGSMLFDASFFNEAADMFGEIDFHVIGAGKAVAGLAKRPNIIVHDEMPFNDTLPYLQHAVFGVAPYRDENTPHYLLDTSLKLAQFALFGIPAVCPDFAVGDHRGRFGYRPGVSQSIRSAIASALANTTPIRIDACGWDDIVDRLVSPDRHARHRIQH